MIHFKKNYLIITLITFISIFFVNCSSDNNDEISTNSTDIKMYKKGLSFIKKDNFEEAALEFDKLFLNYPFSSLATKAEIMSAYAFYENNEIKKAINKLNNFIELNPSGELSDYAQYLLAMCYYIQISSEGRDPSQSQKALIFFKKIIKKNPNSKYAKDAKQKIEYIRYALALSELNIGIFYLKQNAPGSAIKRFRSIIQNYQNTAIIPETLYRLSESLLMIGLKQEAIKSNAILNYNFPKNKWTKLSQKLLNNDLNKHKDQGITSNIINYINQIFD